MNKRFSYPKRYWVYLVAFLICAALLIGNIYRTDSWTGNKLFSEFTQRDFKLLFIFLFEEIVIAALMILFCLLACKTIKKRCAEIAEQWEKSKYSGIKPGDYDYVFFDFEKTKRALILKRDDRFSLYIQEYNKHTYNWESFGDVSVYDSLEEVKNALSYEYDLYCEENTESDECAYEIYKESDL